MSFTFNTFYKSHPELSFILQYNVLVKLIGNVSIVIVGFLGSIKPNPVTFHSIKKSLQYTGWLGRGRLEDRIKYRRLCSSRRMENYIPVKILYISCEK